MEIGREVKKNGATADWTGRNVGAHPNLGWASRRMGAQRQVCRDAADRSS